MKATTAIGIGVAFVGLAPGRDDGRHRSRCLLQHARAHHRPARHVRRRMASTASDGAMKTIPALYKKAIGADDAGPHERARAARRLSPSAPAARACWRSTTRSPRSTTSSPRRACSWSSTAPTPSSSREILENEIDGMSRRHAPARRPSRRPAASRRRMGIIGTVMGLVHVLAEPRQPRHARPRHLRRVHRDALRRRRRPTSSSCPSANAPASCSRRRGAELRTLTLEGILAIQAGDNPRVVADKLLSFIPPAERAARTTRRGAAPALPRSRAGAGRGGGRDERARRTPPPRRRHGTTASTRTRSAGCSPTPT